VFVFVAVAFAVEAFDGATVAPPDDFGIQIWISVPSAPDPLGSRAEDSTEIEMSEFVGATCDDVALASAVCEVGALWFTLCDWAPAEPPPLWAWLEPCPTPFAFVAAAPAVDVLVCETGPSSPGLLLRTTMFILSGST
jgi:hypothetical protein